jgi:hypothetical protein
MPLIAGGTPLASVVTFNSGYLDFGNDRVANLDNVKIETTVTEAQLRQLNSIKMVALKRKGLTVKLTAKLKSWNKEPLIDFFGISSSDSGGTLISFYDGQQTTSNPVFTAYVDDLTAKPFQCQLTDAVILAMPLTASIENYGELDVDIIARDIKIYTVGI